MALFQNENPSLESCWRDGATRGGRMILQGQVMFWCKSSLKSAILCMTLLLVLCLPAMARGTAVVLDITNADRRFDSYLRPYIIKLRKTIQGFWLPSKTRPPLNVSIKFDVIATGELEEVQVLHSSGDSDFDDSALGAIQKAKTFSRPPQPGGLKVIAKFDNSYIDPGEVAGLQTGEALSTVKPASKMTGVLKALKHAGTGTIKTVGRTIASLAPPPTYGYTYTQWTPQYPSLPYSYGPGFPYQQPTSTPTWTNSSQSYYNAQQAMQRNNQAIDSLKQAIALDKQARNLVAMNRPDEALALYGRAAALDPNPASAIIHLSTGLLHSKQGDLDGALDEYKHALSFEPHMPEATANIASCYQQLGEIPLAISWLSRYLAENPTGRDAEDMRKELQGLKEADRSWVKSDPQSSDYFDVVAARGGYRWPKDMIPVTVYFETDSRVGGFRPSFVEIARNCLDEWAAASGHRIDWQEVKEKNAAKIVFRWRSEHDGDQLSGAEGGLAIPTLYDYADGKHTIELARITVWTRSLDGSTFLTDDEMRATTLHEIGHALGLTHSPNNNDVMFFSETSARSPVLTARDKATIIRLYTEGYGVPNFAPAVSCGSSSTPGAAQDIDFGPYMQKLRTTLIDTWFAPVATKDRSVVVVFKIHRGGELSHLRLDRSSGLAIVDQAALKAVDNAAPFPPLPVGCPEDVDIQFTFDREKFLQKRGH